MKKTIALLLVCMVLLISAGCGQNSGTDSSPDELEIIAGSPQEWDNIVIANWGDATATMTDYLYFMRTTQYDAEQQMIGMGSYTEENIGEFWSYSEEDGVTMETMLREQSLTDTLHFSTLHKLAQDAGTQVSESVKEEADLAVENALANLSEDSEAAAQLFLEAYGVMPEQMVAIYNKMDLINQYLAEISVNSDISQDEIDAAYEANPDAYDKVTVRHVLILCDDAMTEEEQAAAKEKADDILAQLENGADIGELAAEYSEDPGSQNNNGEYVFGRGEMVSEFEIWSFNAENGDRGIVKTDYGYHVMEKINSLGFDELYEAIKLDLGDQKANQAVENAMITAENEWTVDQETLSKITLS